MPNPLDYGQMVNALMQMNQGNALMQPVVFDQFKNRRTDPYGMQTEQLAPLGGTRGGGGNGWNVKNYGDGTGDFAKRGRSVETLFNVSKNRDGTVSATVSFDYGRNAPGLRGPANTTTKSGIQGFSEAMRHIQEFVQKVKPAELKFSPLTDKHQMIYDRAVHPMAESLGGRANKAGDYYFIDLPGAQLYPLKTK